MEDHSDSPGELIGTNGPLKGKKFPLTAIALVGRSNQCDIRLAMDDIHDVHAVFADTPEGLQLRAFAGADCHVDNRRVTETILKHKSSVRFGPFGFQVRLNKSRTRTRAAAAMAQQAELAENENETNSRERLPRNKAEEVLADRQVKLLQLLQQLHVSRGSLREERKREKAAIEQKNRQLTEALGEARQREREAARETDRLRSLRKRFIHRWKRHWSAERAKLEKQQSVIQEDFRRLHAERTAFDADRTKSAEDLKLRWRDVEERENEIEVEHAAWNVMQKEERRQLDAERTALDDRATRLDRHEQNWRQEQKKLERRVLELRGEAAGLENRVAHLRKSLADVVERPVPAAGQNLAHTLFSAEIPANGEYIPAPPSADEAALAERRKQVENLAILVADQQAVVAEQIDRIGTVKELWRGEERRVVEEMEALAAELQDVEAELDERARQLDTREGEVFERSIELTERLEELDGRQAQFLLQETAWRSERDRERIEIAQSLGQATRERQTLSDLTARWQEERRREQQNLSHEHDRLAKLRDRYQRSEAENLARIKILDERELTISNWESAIERSRQELLDSCSDPQVAQKRLERYKRHADSLCARAERRLAERFKAIEAESAELRQLQSRIAERMREVVAREGASAEAQVALERLRSEFQLEREKLADEARSWNRSRAAMADEIRALRGQIARWLQIERQSAAPRLAA